MQIAIALASGLIGVAMAAPQGVTDKLTPTGSPPAGCTGSFDGKFEVTVAKVTKEKRDIPEKRAECGAQGILVVTLENGTALDSQGRTGYIASNYQFQFDAPAQAGAIFTSGFSICENNIMALGSSKTFYQCLSGNFYNLYDRTWAEQCEPVSIIAVPCGSGGTADQAPDGQVVGTTVVQTTIVTALSDGQPQVVTTTLPIPIYSTYVPVSQYTDGQIQVTPTGGAPPPPTVTPTAAPPPPPPASTPVVTPPATPVPTPSSSSAAPPSTTSTAVEIPSFTTSPSVPAPSSPAPPTTTSAPPVGGSSHVAAGSMGALIVGMIVAVLCL